MYCQRCGAELPAGESECTQRVRIPQIPPVHSTEQPALYCPHCGEALPVDNPALGVRCGGEVYSAGRDRAWKIETGPRVPWTRTSALGLTSFILGVLALVAAFSVPSLASLLICNLFGLLAAGGGLFRVWCRKDEFAIAGLVFGVLAFLYSVVVLTAGLTAASVSG